ncbi:hypothetical protein D9619_012918 [Psilocybe cf. subviscida]|uniref:NACHT domain-containing protein n=1 Tax=Psilocybe cf. subviscida TaxID=2480587 RepID=A0A8H5F4S9_9AGAR|nr:hypothetical protein D9619_012918 [Psilocybe cf. subviscida]
MGNTSSRVSSAELKSAVVLALQLAEKGVDGLPVPGVIGCISGVLKVIEQEELREANIATFQGLVDKITQFERITVERLSMERNIPEDLNKDVQVLAEKLQNIPVQYEERRGKQSTMRRLRSFISARAHAEALNGLEEDLKSAIQEFQVLHRSSISTGPNYPGILWLSGRAGVGKSTVAKTLATQFDSMKTLGGSFMFSRPNGVVDGSKVFTTLASQLAHHFPRFKNHLVTAIRAKEASMTAEIAQQFEDLLAIPLSQSHSPPVTVLILDALDECTPETLTSVLNPIVENTARLPFLRIVVTSRPENPIREVFHCFSQRIREVNMGNISASGDIAMYLQKRLRDAYTRLIGDSRHAWPADKDLASLVNMADNLSIFAATAVRFIGDELAANPERRLEMILCGQHIAQKHPFSSLDIMYREILRNALPKGEDDVHERFQAVIGTIVFYSNWPYSVESLAEFLAPNYSAKTIRHALKTLHSVLVVPEDDETRGLQVYHKSFLDFITDSKRCTLTEAYLHPSTHHTRLCLQPFDMAESKFAALSVGNLSMDGQTHESFAKTLMSYATDIMLSQWVYHLLALEDQAKTGNKTEDAIIET